MFLTFLMLFGVTSIVRWVIGPSPISRMIPQIHAELLIVGATVAILIAGLILSPAGRKRGAYEPRDFSGNVAIRRFPGSGCGALYRCAVARFRSRRGGSSRCLGPGCGEPPVAYAVLQPGPGWSSISLFVAETLSMAVIVLLVGVCLAVPRLAPFVPWIVGGAIGLAIAMLGTRRGQRESGSPVRAGCSFGTDSLPLGVSARANGGCNARDMGQRDCPAPPICTDTQTMRHSP